MAPPELPGDAPVGRLLERLDREAVLRLGMEADAPLAQRLQRRLLQLLHRAPPLQRDARLDAGLAALAEGDRVTEGLARDEQIALLAPSENALRRLFLSQAGELRHLVVHASVGADHARLTQPMRTPDLEIDGVVRGGDLERPGAELGINVLVGDHRDTALDERHDHLLADETLVSLVAGVHRQRDIGRDRSGAVSYTH